MEDSTGVKPRARSNSVRVLNFDEPASFAQKCAREDEARVAAAGHQGTLAAMTH